MKYCRTCVLPDTRPDSPFNSDGECPACQFSKLAKTDINWEEREQEFVRLVSQYKSSSGYDCLIPVSGGKDSTYQVYLAIKYGLKPLCVCFETTLPTAVGKRNMEAMRSLGVDLIHIKRNPVLFKKLTKAGFEKLGNAQWPMFLGAYTAPIQFAVKFQIPLVFWGENPQAQYGGQKEDSKKSELDEYWVKNLGGLHGATAEELLNGDVHEKDLLMYRYPSLEEIKKLGLKSVFMGYYFNWDQRRQLDMIGKFGWKAEEGYGESSYNNYSGIDCDALQIHMYLKYVKFGFSQATDDASIDVRHGRINREQAVRLVKKFDGRIPWRARRRFIDYLEVTDQAYESVIDSFTNREIFQTNSHGDLVRDIDGSLVKRPEHQL